MRVICSFILACTLKVLALTVVCILSSCKPYFSASFSLAVPGIPVWAGIQLIVSIYVNLDAASLMAIVMLFSPVYYYLVSSQLSKSLRVL